MFLDVLEEVNKRAGKEVADESQGDVHTERINYVLGVLSEIFPGLSSTGDRRRMTSKKAPQPLQSSREWGSLNSTFPDDLQVVPTASSQKRKPSGLKRKGKRRPIKTSTGSNVTWQGEDLPEYAVVKVDTLEVQTVTRKSLLRFCGLDGPDSFENEDAKNQWLRCALDKANGKSALNRSEPDKYSRMPRALRHEKLDGFFLSIVPFDGKDDAGIQSQISPYTSHQTMGFSRKYICPKPRCDKTFNLKYKLDVHSKIVHRTCSECEKSFIPPHFNIHPCHIRELKKKPGQGCSQPGCVRFFQIKAAFNVLTTILQRSTTSALNAVSAIPEAPSLVICQGTKVDAKKNTSSLEESLSMSTGIRLAR